MCVRVCVVMPLAQSGTVSLASVTAAFTRLSWSPDGQSLVVPRGPQQAGGFSSIVFNREGKQKLTLPGPRSMSVAKVAPVLFHDHETQSTSSSSSSSAAKPAYLMAIGDQQGVLSIWLSSRLTPVLLIDNWCQAAITDVTWSALGDAVVVAAEDGRVLYLQLRPAALHVTPWTSDEHAALTRSLYGTHT